MVIQFISFETDVHLPIYFMSDRFYLVQKLHFFEFYLLHYLETNHIITNER